LFEGFEGFEAFSFAELPACSRQGFARFSVSWFGGFNIAGSWVQLFER